MERMAVQEERSLPWKEHPSWNGKILSSSDLKFAARTLTPRNSKFLPGARHVVIISVKKSPFLGASSDRISERSDLDPVSVDLGLAL
jgi:hypothetical protein